MGFLRPSGKEDDPETKTEVWEAPGWILDIIKMGANGTVLFTIGTSSNNKQQAMAALEVPMKTRSIALTNETSPLVLKAVDTGVSMEVVMALK
ncbi:MAG: hypothetical protein JRN66_06970 [Nitrososphaerota archaeon]|nr:hypothetical protein [Nitrososphaerota archaeon]